jgi:hypothetical protein
MPTKEGELLWPAKVGPNEVAMLKRKLGSYGYSGQYQQRPSPAGDIHGPPVPVHFRSM